MDRVPAASECQTCSVGRDSNTTRWLAVDAPVVVSDEQPLPRSSIPELKTVGQNYCGDPTVLRDSTGTHTQASLAILQSDFADRFPRHRIPDTKLRVDATGRHSTRLLHSLKSTMASRDKVPVECEEQTDDVLSVRILDLDRLAAVDERPDSNCLMTARRQEVSVSGKSQTEGTRDSIPAFQTQDVCAGLAVPDSDKTVTSCGRVDKSVGRERDGNRTSHVPAYRGNERFGLNIPQPYNALLA